ncbi:hypothetical protein BGX20_007010, partial [Mortierella sp. AD010]
QRLIQRAINDADARKYFPKLEEWECIEILRYSKDFDGIDDLLQTGWSHIKDFNYEHLTISEAKLSGFARLLHNTVHNLWMLYENYNNSLPKEQSETWYAHDVRKIMFKLVDHKNEWLEVKLGEVSSWASSYRRNDDRDLGTRVEDRWDHQVQKDQFRN